MYSFFTSCANNPEVLPCVRENDIIFGHILGSGSFGTVYYGTMKGEPVAIKKIIKKPYSQKEAEINLHGTLSHPNIVRALARYNVPEPDNDVYLILEYMHSKDLLEYLIDPNQKTILSLNIRIAIMQDIINALIYLHQTMHILHRDIKPDNILLDQHMRAKLCDFGASTTIEEAKSLLPCGTHDYFAPELLKGRSRYHSEKTDIYAMGVTVFTIITIIQPKEKHKVDIIKIMMVIVDSVPLETAKAFKNMVDNSTASNPNHRMSLDDMSKLIQAIARLPAGNHVQDESKVEAISVPTETDVVTEFIEVSEEQEIEHSCNCTIF